MCRSGRCPGPTNLIPFGIRQRVRGSAPFSRAACRTQCASESGARWLQARSRLAHAHTATSHVTESVGRQPAPAPPPHRARWLVGRALADGAHAMVQPARPEPALRDLEAAAFAEQKIPEGHAHLCECALWVRRACARACAWARTFWKMISAWSCSWPNSASGRSIWTPGASRGISIIEKPTTGRRWTVVERSRGQVLCCVCSRADHACEHTCMRACACARVRIMRVSARACARVRVDTRVGAGRGSRLCTGPVSELRPRNTNTLHSGRIAPEMYLPGNHTDACGVVHSLVGNGCGWRVPFVPVDNVLGAVASDRATDICGVRASHALQASFACFILRQWLSFLTARITLPARSLRRQSGYVRREAARATASFATHYRTFQAPATCGAWRPWRRPNIRECRARSWIGVAG